MSFAGPDNQLHMTRRRAILASLLTLGAVGLGGACWTTRWKYIVIHHSAGSFGDIDLLQRVHRERQPGDPIDAIPYHYVVGNGNGLAVGEIASDWRQSLDLWGAHVSANNMSRNLLGLGICVVGNLEEEPMPKGQLEALVALTRRLMSRYGIPLQNVQGHGMIAGEATKCPGRHFPMDDFIQALA